MIGTTKRGSICNNLGLVRFLDTLRERERVGAVARDESREVGRGQITNVLVRIGLGFFYFFEYG